MSEMKKYIDKLIWVLGVVGALVTCVGYKQYYIKYIIYINIILFLAVIYLLYSYLNSNNTNVKEVTTEELIRDIINHSKKLKKIMIYNPDKSYDWLERLNKEFINNAADISYLGEAEDFMGILKKISNSESAKKSDKLITNFAYKHMFIILTDENVKVSIIGYVIEDKSYMIILKDKVLNKIVSTYINKKTLNGNGIDLGIFENPNTILKIIKEKKDTYIKSFNELRRGSITFYGTEVSEVQSGWLESDDFKEITTLDLTTNPGIFKNRERYNKANENFIKKDGVIKRVYMILRKELNNESFSQNLYEAIKFQKDIGVKIGIQYLDCLPQEYIQDFIMYDKNIVLLENKQADKHYSLASSTAYFDKEKILNFEKIFIEVWNGKHSNKKPTELAFEYIVNHEKKKQDLKQITN